MRTIIDGDHIELKRVLDELLAEDVDITVREVARRHPALKNASAFTRSQARTSLIERARTRQVDARSVRGVPESVKAVSLAEQLSRKSERITALEKQIAALVASHAACVRAVMQHGGMQSLQKFWRDYSSIEETLNKLNSIPVGGRVVQISDPKNDGPDRA